MVDPKERKLTQSQFGAVMRNRSRRSLPPMVSVVLSAVMLSHVDPACVRRQCASGAIALRRRMFVVSATR